MNRTLHSKPPGTARALLSMALLSMIRLVRGFILPPSLTAIRDTRAAPARTVMDVRRAIMAGLAATGVATLTLIAVAALPVLNPASRLIAPAFFEHAPLLVLAGVGLLITLAGMVLAVDYGLVVELVFRRSEWWLGALLGVTHALTSWLAIGLLVWFFPRTSGMFAAELHLLFHSAAVMVGWLVAHTVYGIVVTTLYGPPSHSPRVINTITCEQIYP